VEYNHLTIYRYEGISPEKLDDDKLVFSDNTLGTWVYLTKDIDRHCCELDAVQVLGNMCLMGELNEVDEVDESELIDSVEAQLLNIREKRIPIKKYGAFVVIKIQGDADLSINEEHQVETEDYRICYDAVDKEKLKTDNRNIIESIVVSLSLIFDPSCYIEKIVDGIYFSDSEGKLLGTLSLTAGKVRGFVSQNPSEESLSGALELIQCANSSQELSSVFRLLTESLEITQDRFKGFLAAWAALEIFINKSFKLYEKKFISGVSDAHSSHGVNNFLSRIHEVMKDKYRLTDKLSLIASFLSDDIEDDICLFGDIKKCVMRFLMEIHSLKRTCRWKKQEFYLENI
jgi:hypothetical protein